MLSKGEKAGATRAASNRDCPTLSGKIRASGGTTGSAF